MLQTFLFLSAAPVLAAEELILRPDRGLVGDTIDLAGTGFSSFTDDVNIYFSAQLVSVNERLDDDVNVYKLVKRTRADSNGNVDAQLQIPAFIDEGTVGAFSDPMIVTTGTYYIFAAYADSDQIQVVAPFVVRGLLLSADSASSGDSLAVSGVGFARNQNVTLTFSDAPLTELKASSDGSFTVEITVPAVALGTYTLKAEDRLGNSAQLPLDVVVPPVPELGFSPLTNAAFPAFVGQQLTLSGVDFKPESTITVAYNKKLIARLNSDSFGSFSYVFTVPSQPAGEYVLTADDGTNLLPAYYVIESDAPAAPVLVSPAAGMEVTGRLTVDWNDVTDKSLPVSYLLQLSAGPDFAAPAVEESDLAESTYSLTSDEFAQLYPATYYWRVRAIDAAFNLSDWSETRSFTVPGPIAPSPTPTPPASGSLLSDLKWWLVGLAVVVLGVLGFFIIRKAVLRSRSSS